MKPTVQQSMRRLADAVAGRPIAGEDEGSASVYRKRARRLGLLAGVVAFIATEALAWWAFQAPPLLNPSSWWQGLLAFLVAFVVADQVADRVQRSHLKKSL